MFGFNLIFRNLNKFDLYIYAFVPQLFADG